MQQPTVMSLLQLQHKSSVIMRSIPDEINTNIDTKDISSDSTTDSYHGYGRLGQVECSLDNLKSLERMSE